MIRRRRFIHSNTNFRRLNESHRNRRMRRLNEDDEYVSLWDIWRRLQSRYGYEEGDVINASHLYKCLGNYPWEPTCDIDAFEDEFNVTIDYHMNESRKYRRMRRLNETFDNEDIIYDGFELVDGHAIYVKNAVFTDDMFKVARDLGYVSPYDDYDEDYDEDDEFNDVLEFLEDKGIYVTGHHLESFMEFIRDAKRNGWTINDIQNFDEIPERLKRKVQEYMR